MPSTKAVAGDMNVTLVASVPAGTGPPGGVVVAVVPPVVEVPVPTAGGAVTVGLGAVRVVP